jgi:Zn-dependent protease/predicted transcriptional regulator
MGEPRSQTLRGPFGRPALRLGRVLGIEVGLDFTWIFIFLLITLSLAQKLGADHETWPVAARWGGALAASLLFFASILLHELGHSVTSNALGVPVRSITLFLFGGVASLSKEPERPRDAFLIGAAGPAVSVLLGLAFLLLWAALPAQPLTLGVAADVCLLLGQANLVLAVFNLFPGFPLDGGHLLRAAVWAWTGSLERATRVAAAMGALFAMGLIGLGILIAIPGGNLLGGLWLVFIGWFVLSAARGSTAQVVLERGLSALSVGEVVDTDPPMVSRASSVADVIAGPVLKQGLRWVLVRDHEGPVGLVTLHEIKAVPEAERANTPIGQVMRPRARLVTVQLDATLWQALKTLQEAGVNQLPVLDAEGRFVGMLSRERLLGVVRNQLELSGQGGR